MAIKILKYLLFVLVVVFAFAMGVKYSYLFGDVGLSSQNQTEGTNATNTTDSSEFIEESQDGVIAPDFIGESGVVPEDDIEGQIPVPTEVVEGVVIMDDSMGGIAPSDAVPQVPSEQVLNVDGMVVPVVPESVVPASAPEFDAVPPSVVPELPVAPSAVPTEPVVPTAPVAPATPPVEPLVQAPQPSAQPVQQARRQAAKTNNKKRK
ncbi:MAG: hypothetical protein LBH46_02145 [Rickettsiales bacterium]|jgi:hypothetical protein|nr:hypothetical protein [Rickettsiales bacterium]